MAGKERQMKFLQKFRETKRDVATPNPDFLYKPRKGDVIIFGPPKCGTTWLQNIMHQLRTKGDKSFEKHDEETWLILHPNKAARDLNADQKYSPRVFKSHLVYGPFQDLSPVKCVVVIRDPYDTSYSYSKFRYRMYGVDEDVDDEDEAEFVKEFYKIEDFDYFHMFQTWWPHRNDPNVFWVFYEDLQKNMQSVIRQLAEFVVIPLTPEELENVCKFCTYEFMLENRQKFRPDTCKIYNGFMKTNEKWDITSVVRPGGGKTGQGKEKIGPKLKATLDDLWADSMGKDFGFKNYDELYEQNSRFKSE